MGDPATGLHFCCAKKELSGNGGSHTLYPIEPWELGPSISEHAAYCVVCGTHGKVKDITWQSSGVCSCYYIIAGGYVLM